MIVALALQVQGFARIDLGEMEPAWACLTEALTLDRMLGQLDMLTREIGAMAMIVLARGDPVRAARLTGAMTALREQIGAYLEEPLRPRFDRMLAAIRSALSDAAFEAAWAAGREMTLDEAIACALESRPPDAASPQASGGGLSPRELEVVRLLAEGRTNQEIAAALGISQHTAINHVRNIMNKLGLDSRAAVA